MILKNISEVLKDTSIHTVSSDDTVQIASRLMAKHNERAVLVSDDGDVKGILSDKDIVFKCVAEGLDVQSTAVTTIMTTSVQTIQANDSVAHAIDMMVEGNFHHLPVMEGETFIGMIYSDDIPDEYRLLLEHYKELKGI
jgi:CBS domain-containing protein